MIRQIELGPTHFSQLRRLVQLIQNQEIALGGNRSGNIYGRLNCRAGKRMNPHNRVFFRDDTEAVDTGFRPWAVCLPEAYKSWKETQNAFV